VVKTKRKLKQKRRRTGGTRRDQGAEEKNDVDERTRCKRLLPKQRLVKERSQGRERRCTGGWSGGTALLRLVIKGKRYPNPKKITSGA